MSPYTRGESNGARPTHPEGKVPYGTGWEIKDYWGGDSTIEHQSLRFGFLNIQTFPTNVLHHKNGCIVKIVNDNHLNCLGMAEMNIYWPAVSTQQQLQERTRGWFETTVSAAAYNKENTKFHNHQGGTAIIARSQFAHRSYKRLYDKLGQWMMMTFRGKEGMGLMVISVYRPQISKRPYMVYQQQLQYYGIHNNTKDPIANYDTNLFELIQGWMDNGDQVIVIIDANVDLTNNKKDTFRYNLESLGLNELIMSKHPNLTLPSTRTPGTKTIDGIFGTPALDVVWSGYAPFVGYSDHRLLIFDGRVHWDFSKLYNNHWHVGSNAMIPARLKNIREYLNHC